LHEIQLLPLRYQNITLGAEARSGNWRQLCTPETGCWKIHCKERNRRFLGAL